MKTPLLGIMIPISAHFNVQMPSIKGQPYVIEDVMEAHVLGAVGGHLGAHAGRQLVH